jgi:transposase InsO family protein
MDEELKKRIAVFRYGVISDIVGARRLSRGERKRLLRERCGQVWQIPGSIRTHIAPSTVKEWITRYKQSGNKLESLYPQERSDRGALRSVDPDTAAGIISLRKELPEVTLPVLLREARERKIILPGKSLSSSTLYRFLKANGLMEGAPAIPSDRRRFEAEQPNELWQSDVMHGPSVVVDGKQRKTYLTAFIDDHSRLIPHAEFFLSERLDNFLIALRKALRMRGLPRKLYVDNGPAFRSEHLAHICASLGVALRHAKPYQPEGKGKIERWFRTVRMSFLSTAMATTLPELNDALGRWVAAYHEATHGTTGEAPIKRYTRQLECVRPAPKDMEDHFRKEARRTVARDRTFSLLGRLYEAPLDTVGKQVALLFHEHDPSRVEVFFGGKTYGFAQTLDVHVNCRVTRWEGKTSLVPEDDGKRYGGGRLFTSTQKKEDGHHESV